MKAKSQYQQVKPRNVNLGSGSMNGDPIPEDEKTVETDIDEFNQDEEHDLDREEFDIIRSKHNAQK